MERNQIHRLLEKYFEGNTTLEEERILTGFLMELDSRDTELLPVKKQFELFRTGQELSFNTDQLDEKIMRSIAEYENQQIPPVRKIRITRFLLAASIAIAVVLTGIFLLRSGNKVINDTYTDPRLAYEETQKTLIYISSKINEGMKPLNNISKINSGTEQLRNLEKIDKSLGMLNLVSFINPSSNLKK
jgi:hypothetical protein